MYAPASIMNGAFTAAGLLDLFPRWVYYSQASTQYTEIALKILANYILLGGADFVKVRSIRF